MELYNLLNLERPIMRTFNVYTDPSHGWAKVPLSLLKELDIHFSITPFSYLRNQFAYLEEDCDLGLFIKTYKAKFDRDPIFKEYHTNKQSKIRSYDDYWYGEPLPPFQFPKGNEFTPQYSD